MHNVSGKENHVLKLVAQLGLKTSGLYLFFYNSKMDKTGLSDLRLKKKSIWVNVITMFKLSFPPPGKHASFSLMSWEPSGTHCLFLLIFQSNQQQPVVANVFGPFWAGQPSESLWETPSF